MIPGIEAIYQVIADEMVNELLSPWRYAKVEAVFFPKSSEYNGEYLTTSGREQSFRVTIKAVKAFSELRQKFNDAGQRMWGQVSFELHPDGTFNVKWGYDNCDENGNTIWDPDEWSRQQQERRKQLTKP